MCYYTLQVNSFINDGKKKEKGFNLPLIAFSYSCSRHWDTPIMLTNSPFR